MQRSPKLGKQNACHALHKPHLKAVALLQPHVAFHCVSSRVCDERVSTFRAPVSPEFDGAYQPFLVVLLQQLKRAEIGSLISEEFVETTLVVLVTLLDPPSHSFLDVRMLFHQFANTRQGIVQFASGLCR